MHKFKNIPDIKWNTADKQRDFTNVDPIKRKNSKFCSKETQWKLF